MLCAAPSSSWCAFKFPPYPFVHMKYIYLVIGLHSSFLMSPYRSEIFFELCTCAQAHHFRALCCSVPSNNFNLLCVSWHEGNSHISWTMLMNALPHVSERSSLTRLDMKCSKSPCYMEVESHRWMCLCRSSEESELQMCSCWLLSWKRESSMLGAQC